MEREAAMRTNDGMPIMDEVAEDKLFRQFTGDLSKYSEWDKAYSDNYTEEDRQVDKRIEEEA